MKTLLKSFTKDTSGATAIEYGLIAALIAVVIITSVTLIGQRLSGSFNTIGNRLAPTATASR